MAGEDCAKEEEGEEVLSFAFVAQGETTIVGEPGHSASITQRAHTQRLNKLRETQVEQGNQLNKHGRILNEHTSMLTEHGQRLSALETKVDNGFTKVNIEMDHIATLLQRVIDKS